MYILGMSKDNTTSGTLSNMPMVSSVDDGLPGTEPVLQTTNTSPSLIAQPLFSQDDKTLKVQFPMIVSFSNINKEIE